jgi:hypothetical protein
VGCGVQSSVRSSMTSDAGAHSTPPADHGSFVAGGPTIPSSPAQRSVSYAADTTDTRGEA